MNRQSLMFALWVAAAALLVMGGVVFNDFVAWDDPQTIVENPSLHPPTLQSLKPIWTRPAAGLYVPLTHTAWAAIARFTHHPWAFHLASVLAHCAASVLVFAILRTLLKSDLASCIGAVVFAIHPLQVESIAWASGLKDVLAAALALAALHVHISAKPKSIIASTVLFAPAMLAKPSAASILLIALIIDYVILRRPIRSTILALLPWILITIPLLIVARFVQETPLVTSIAIWQRPLVAGDAIAFYLLKLLAPFPLAIDYGRTPIAIVASGQLMWTWLIPLALALILAWSRNRALIAAALIMLAGLIWNLGLTPFQFQLHSTVADHYMYLAMLGPALAVAWIVTRYSRAVVAFSCIAIVAMIVLSVRQITVWRDSITLFEHTLAVNPRSIATHNNLGRVLGEHGDFDGARAQFIATLTIDPSNEEAMNDLAIVQTDERIAQLAASIQLAEMKSQDVSADRRALVKLLASRNRWGEVVDQLTRAAAVEPHNPDIAVMLRYARQRASAIPVATP